MMKDLEVAGETTDKVKQNFDLAVRLVKSLPQKGSFQPSYAEAAKIYSYFKQAKFGPCNIPKPGFWDYINRAKWDAWTALGDMSTEAAMENYVSEIKVMFVRVKEVEEFKEKEHEFAETLIPFCQNNNIPLSQTLLDLVKKEQEKESAATNGKHKCNTNVEIVSLENDNVLSEVESECFIPVENGHDHSILVETALPPLKSVKFNLSSDGDIKDIENEHFVSDQNGFNGNSQMIYGIENSGNKSEEEEDDEEIFCDPLNPADIKDGERSNITESPLMTTDSGVTFNETVVERSSPKKQPVVESTLSDSSSQEPNVFHQVHRNRSQKHSKFRHHPHHTGRSHKRLDGNHESSHRHHNGANDQSNSTNQHRANRSSNRQIASNNSHTSRHSSRNNSDSGGNSSDSSESYVSSSGSGDTVGLKIVDALERMENNMQDIIDRLDSIEGTIRTVTKPKTPWWQEYLPSRSMMIWAIWPVLVNILFLLYWRRIKRQQIKKC